MTARYYAPHLSDTDACELEGSEFHHLTRVMRAGPGDQITLFDGNGHSAVAQIVELSKSHALLRILNRRSDSDRVVPHVVVASAIPKADRFRWLVARPGANRSG